MALCSTRLYDIYQLIDLGNFRLKFIDVRDVYCVDHVLIRAP